LNEAGQSPTKELLDLAKSIPGKGGNQRMNSRYGRPDQSYRPMNQYNNGMKPMGGQGWMNGGGNQMGYHNSNNAYNKGGNDRFNKYNNNGGQNSDEEKKPHDGGYKRNPDFNNRFKNPMQNGFVNNQVVPQQNGGGGYQKPNYGGQEGGYKPRNSFVKPDFNGNPRNFGGDKPPFQNTYMGNKPRAPFNNNGQTPRFAGNNSGEYAGGTQKYNKFENYKGAAYGEKGAEGSDVFQGVKSFSSANRHYNAGNRFNDHQNAQMDGQSPAVLAQQPPPQQFVQADAIDGAQPFDSNIIAGYRMVANGQIPPFPPAFGEKNKLLDS
jgi:hypothetical protein